MPAKKPNGDEKAQDALVRLAALIEQQDYWRKLIDEAVQLALDQGYSWQDIADVYGVKKQTVWKKFKDVVKKPKDKGRS